MTTKPLVTIALPVFNGADSLEHVAHSALEQEYQNIELVISDNASTDCTEEICRELARSDERVRYHRQSRNIGLVKNFEWLKHHCRGSYVRWIGDTDEIRPTYVSRCLEVFGGDPRLVLVTTQLEYVDILGRTESTLFDGVALRSDDPVVRFEEMLRLLACTHLLLDPLYGLARVDFVSKIRHDQMLRGDEVYAVKLALGGPWGHVPEILGSRGWTNPLPSKLVDQFNVPRWHVPIRGLIEARRMIEVINAAGLDRAQSRRAKRAVRAFWVRRHWSNIRRRALASALRARDITASASGSASSSGG